ncbi:hypothetical protein BV20DRAFT_960860 [Pilatotrama ljubarskyi]|nr:hypothetical protein BV20DRAFT_960860 [Pilatotrama ljubarskyi]
MATAPKPSASEKPKSSATDKPKSTTEKPKSAAADKPRSTKATKEKAPKEKAIKAKQATVKKPKAAAATKKTKTDKPAQDDGKAHPSWKDMIKECIVAHKDESRSGVSRSTIKKFVSEKYGLDATSAVNLSHLNRAITNGAEEGLFALPKGPSGKVKLAPKTKPAPSNENIEPAPVKKAAPAKKTEAPKKAAPAVKKAPAKPAKAAKASSTTKKASTAKTSEKVRGFQWNNVLVAHGLRRRLRRRLQRLRPLRLSRQLPSLPLSHEGRRYAFVVQCPGHN